MNVYAFSQTFSGNKCVLLQWRKLAWPGVDCARNGTFLRRLGATPLEKIMIIDFLSRRQIRKENAHYSAKA
jgi:hypothetical protein